jgi:hypothetical protein
MQVLLIKATGSRHKTIIIMLIINKGHIRVRHQGHIQTASLKNMKGTDNFTP